MELAKKLANHLSMTVNLDESEEEEEDDETVGSLHGEKSNSFAWSQTLFDDIVDTTDAKLPQHCLPSISNGMPCTSCFKVSWRTSTTPPSHQVPYNNHLALLSHRSWEVCFCHGGESCEWAEEGLWDHGQPRGGDLHKHEEDKSSSSWKTASCPWRWTSAASPKSYRCLNHRSFLAPIMVKSKMESFTSPLTEFTSWTNRLINSANRCLNKKNLTRSDSSLKLWVNLIPEIVIIGIQIQLQN